MLSFLNYSVVQQKTCGLYKDVAPVILNFRKFPCETFANVYDV